MSSFSPCGVISLSTDFGLRDPFVGLMKAVILKRFPAARLVDLCHELPPFKPEIASFWLARCWRYFPDGTIHLAVVDPGVGGKRAMRLSQVENHVFVAPDNGLLNDIEQSSEWRFSRQFSISDLHELRLDTISQTFHGRDVFAPLVAALSQGSMTPESLGQLVPRGDTQPSKLLPAGAIGQVKIIDHFGNLITDVELPERPTKSGQKYKINGQDIDFMDTYESEKPGRFLALRNSFGVLEIAVAQGNAATRLGAQPGTPIFAVDL